MKTRKTRFLLTALWALLFCSSPLPAQESFWEIGPRTLPLSAGVSDAFRESQANTPKQSRYICTLATFEDVCWAQSIPTTC